MLRAAALLACALATACAGPGDRDPAAGGAVTSAGPTPDALVLVSLDGFRWDYQRLTETRARFLLGNHGGDPEHPDMQGIFIAAGPAFAEGVRVAAFENIEIYNLLAAALGIEPAPNQENLGHVQGVLR